MSDATAIHKECASEKPTSKRVVSHTRVGGRGGDERTSSDLRRIFATSGALAMTSAGRVPGS